MQVRVGIERACAVRRTQEGPIRQGVYVTAHPQCYCRHLLQSDVIYETPVQPVYRLVKLPTSKDIFKDILKHGIKITIADETSEVRRNESFDKLSQVSVFK